MRLISGSLWRKVLALVMAVTGFVFLYETRIIDSTALSVLDSIGTQATQILILFI